jgi:hypothetical protein
MDNLMIVRKTVNEDGSIVLFINASWTIMPPRDEVTKMLSLLAEKYGSENVALFKKVPLPDFI